MTTLDLSRSLTALGASARKRDRAFGLLAVGLPLNPFFAALATRRARRDLRALPDDVLTNTDQIGDLVTTKASCSARAATS